MIMITKLINNNNNNTKLLLLKNKNIYNNNNNKLSILSTFINNNNNYNNYNINNKYLSTKTKINNNSSNLNNINKKKLSTTTSSNNEKLILPPMVYISGEEMTRYCMKLILDQWIKPHCDISNWKFYDLSCINRDTTKDQVLHDAVNAGKKLGSIFKEPTVTPNEAQVRKMGLTQPWGSPNGAMRRGWNGISISRDTIHIEGMELGFKKKVVFDRHAVGGEYSAGWSNVRAGEVKTVWVPDDGSDVVTVDRRRIDDDEAVVVTYDNPLDNVYDMAHLFFKRCLDAKVVPYVVTKKTVFKWQSKFWLIFEKVFDEHYKTDFIKQDLLPTGNLQHLISDAATMQIVRWTDGGFGMAAHNYDGDMLTDEISQVHRSPGFITSNLVGKDDDGKTIKEFEASHGTVSDMDESRLKGNETSLNPLGMVEALIGAINYSVERNENVKPDENHPIVKFTTSIRKYIHLAFANKKGTRDLTGSTGLTTEEFVDLIQGLLDGTISEQSLKTQKKERVKPSYEKSLARMDIKLVKQIFDDLDDDENGQLSFEEFAAGLVKLNVAPKVFLPENRKGSAKDRFN